MVNSNDVKGDGTVLQVDARVWRCPMPLLKLKQALRGSTAGQTIVLLACDAGSARDIPAWLAGTPHQLTSVEQGEGEWHFRIRVGVTAP